MNYDIRDLTQHPPQIRTLISGGWGWRDTSKIQRLFKFRGQAPRGRKGNGRDKQPRSEAQNSSFLLSTWVPSQHSYAEASPSAPLRLVYISLCISSVPTGMLSSAAQGAQMSHTNSPKTFSINKIGSYIIYSVGGFAKDKHHNIVHIIMESSPNDSCFSVWLLPPDKSASLFLLTKSLCSSGYCDTLLN